MKLLLSTLLLFALAGCATTKKSKSKSQTIATTEVTKNQAFVDSLNEAAATKEASNIKTKEASKAATVKDETEEHKSEDEYSLMPYFVDSGSTIKGGDSTLPVIEQADGSKIIFLPKKKASTTGNKSSKTSTDNSTQKETETAAAKETANSKTQVIAANNTEQNKTSAQETKSASEVEKAGLSLLVKIAICLIIIGVVLFVYNKFVK